MIYIKVIHEVVILSLGLTPAPLDPPFKLSIKSLKVKTAPQN